ncbi:MAG: hypothetical protein L3J67_13155 [Hyphomicrobiaceae bacterium]|nr:hypothetical protein [Hyphomicrobiaceae bacterium]
MKKLFKAALIALSMTGFSVAATSSASANDAGLMKYAQEPTVKKADMLSFKPFKVAGRYTRRRNRAIAGGIAVGIAALIISEAVRSKRRRNHTHYNNNRSYGRYGASPRQCRRWADKCDYHGRRWACRKWNNRCR